VTRAALERQESRGAQFRADYPEKSADFGKVNIVVSKDPDGGMKITRVPVVPVSPELRTVIEEMK
ncbi:MAG TPA: fumarate reductase/succinate dehydrogenase flavoprotein subunit, partial [Thermoanaerobaculia bacterium]